MSERQKYTGDLYDFGAGSSDNFTFKGPKGKKGQLIDYGVEQISETFAGTTTSAMVSVGNASDPDHYGEEISFASYAADTVGSVSARTLATSPSDLRATYIVEPDLPADTAIYIVCTSATGSPTGQAKPFAIVEWQD